MVVDDSAVVRGLETRMLESDPAIQVIASVGNGEAAIRALERHDVEVVVLDIEMPVMDGLTALPKILERAPGVRVIMSSTLTQKNAEVSLRALELGATDYVSKPTSSRELTGGTDFRTELIEKVKVLGQSARRNAAGRPRAGAAAAAAAPAARQAFARPGTAPAAAPRPTSMRAAAAAAPASSIVPPRVVTLRQPGREKPDVIAIGSSTGGPQALFNVLTALKKGGGVTQPILITQHMPATFTTILADHISRISGLPAKEGQDGDAIVGGQVYIAPGDFHMLVETRGTNKIIKLDKGPPENFCRPSVDPMFRSIAKAWGGRVIAAVLTGMGSDGAKGGQVIVDAGGTVIAQDEATSVVWGMPGATAHAGVCSAVVPLDEVAPYILKMARRA
ncbi:protein-glutamate methylesterase/protein-glutamine glutaminase [Novispirillum sp. DQ9]|uniref:protein-glutamate methylesterase/protein-glutamine glutaminase n=1 Tax=Novispirillum sp. DQ9 TaxID=3398612 RepID=UPI003C7984F3